MADFAAKVAAARRAGYSDAEITAHLGRDASMAPKIQQAREAGYNDKAIVAFLSRGTSQSRAAADAERRASTVPNQVRAFNQGVTLGFSDEIDGAIAGAETAVSNLGRRLTGREIPYTAKEASDAVRAEERRRQKGFAADHPVQSAGLTIVGGVAAPGSKAAGAAIKSAKTFREVVARSGLVGGLYGAAAGAGDAEGGLVERGKGALKGGVVGSVAGAALPAAVKVGGDIGRRTASGAKEAVSRVTQAAGVRPPEVVVSPSASRRAEEIVGELAARRGLTAADATADAAYLAGKPITGAELIGREAMTQLTAIGRRSGETGDALGDLMAARADETGGRLIEDFSRATGIAPEAVADDFVALTDALRRQAAPAYDAAYAAGPLDSPTLQALLARPSVKEAARRAVRIAREEGRDPEALGLTFIDNMDDWASEVPKVDPSLGAAQAAAARGATPRAGQGPSLVKFIADGGGIIDDGGEIRALDGELWNRGKAFQRRLIGEADSADGWAMKAWEGGYFPELTERPTPRQLYDVMAAELRGKPRFAREANEAAVNRARMLDEAEEMAYRGGPDDVPSPDDYVGRPEPRMEPVDIPQFTTQTFDYIKRGLNDVIEGYRDPTTRRLNLDTEGRAKVGTAQALRDEMVALNPAYGAALERGGEPLRLETAYRDIPKLMGNSVPERLFNQRWGKLSDAEKQAAMGGFANNLFEKARAGRLKPRDFRAPAFRSKLRTMLGEDQAGQFIAALDQEVRLARGGRMAPGTNSVTAEIQEANREFDRGVGVMAEIQRRADAGQGPIKAVTGAAANAVASPFAGFVRGVQAPYGQAVRDEVGRILMDPEETLQVLRRYQAAPPPVRTGPIVPAAVPGVSAYMVDR